MPPTANAGSFCSGAVDQLKSVVPYRQCSAHKTWVVSMEMGGALSIGRFAVSRWRVSMGIECGWRPAGIWQEKPWQHGWEVETAPTMEIGAC